MTATLIAPCAAQTSLRVPFFLMRVQAGFPSPAQDYIEKRLDLNELCIKHPAATYFVRVAGDSMCEAGILDGDVLIVDRSLKANHADIVIAEINGEMTVKVLELKPQVRLVARNAAYPPIEGAILESLTIFGVVTSVVRNIRG